MVAEGVGGVDEIAKKIEAETGVESRATILGHIQRGGNPTVRDRLRATQFGFAAVKLLEQGIGNRVVAIKKETIMDFDIFEALGMKNSVDLDMYKMALEISI